MTIRYSRFVPKNGYSYKSFPFENPSNVLAFHASLHHF